MLEALEQVDEDFGHPGLLHDGTVVIMCVSCHLWFDSFQEFRLHVDHSWLHRRRSRVCIRRDRAAINRWEEHRNLLRRELGLDQ